MLKKIFGIGLCKTGTNSLHESLKILGYRSIHFPRDETTYQELSMGNFKLSIMNQYDAANDLSIAPYYVELDNLFPNSKFILTVRDKKEWLQSIGNHWMHNKFLYDESIDISHYQKIARFVTLATFGCYQFNKKRFSSTYNRHTSNVIDYFKDRNNLLIMNICGGDKWNILCDFLKKPIPDVSFPHENKGKYINLEKCAARRLFL